ncbi:MAG: LPS-assembly protein LptD [Planctomycetes bacterium]|nr:LPS-assembly protein LptD [Planctomycetota bacterium]
MRAGDWRRTALVGALLLGAGTSLAAQDDGLSFDGGQAVTVHQLGSQFGFPDPDDPDRLVVVFLDGVEVEQGTRHMLADTLVVVLRRGASAASDVEAPAGGTVFPGSRVLEFFVDGDVSLEDRDETILGASSIHVDNVTGRMSVLEGSWHLTAKDEPFIVRYELMRDLGNGVREMEGLQYTTCEYAHAHWALTTPWARIVPTPAGRVLHTGGNTFEVADVPLLWFPGLHLNVDRDRPPIKSVGFGTSRRFGTEISTLWGADADEFLTNLADSLGMDGPVRGAWEARLDNYSKRGVFVEPSLTYQGESSEGRVFFSYIHDTAEVDDLDVPVEDHTRGRFDLRHRTKIDEDRTVDVEFSHLSDPGYLREYYEDEARRGKEQETYVNYRDVHDNDAISVLGRWRLNGWQTQDEYLPEVVHRRMGEPVETPFGTAHLTRREFVSRARLASPDDTLDTGWNTRAGSVGDLVWDTDVLGDRVQVNTGWDVTGFEDTVDQGGIVRGALLAGAAWSRTYSGTGDAMSDVWNFHGVRQILEPRVGYDAVLEVNHQPDELIAIDQTETLRDRSAFLVGLRHRVQTHQRGAVATVLDTDVTVPFYPHEDRDNLVTVYDEVPPGSGTIVTTQEGRTVGPVRFDVRWRPGADIFGLRQASVTWRGEVDSHDRNLDRSFASYSNSFADNGRFLLANNKVDQAPAHSNFGTVGVAWDVSPKWTVAWFLQEDLVLHQTARQALVFRERAHRWLIDIELSERRGVSTVDGSREGERRVTLRMRPSVLVDQSESLLDELGRIR